LGVQRYSYSLIFEITLIRFSGLEVVFHA